MLVLHEHNLHEQLVRDQQVQDQLIFFVGFAFLLINSSLPIKSSSLVLSGTVKPIPASKGSV